MTIAQNGADKPLADGPPAFKTSLFVILTPGAPHLFQRHK